jgi:hypothetical protein
VPEYSTESFAKGGQPPRDGPVRDRRQAGLLVPAAAASLEYRAGGVMLPEYRNGTPFRLVV